MQKLPIPSVGFPNALAEAILGIGCQATQGQYTAAFVNAQTIEIDYAAKAQAASLFAEQRVAANCDPVVHGTLKKSDLTKLYTQYFVPEKKPARALYDAIKVTANGKCPLCGGIGHVRTLDHYLPKANFPLYSIMPTNLVPCCRDCNIEKLNAFAAVRGDQALHPYFDNDRFFNEKWVYAKVIPSAPRKPPLLEFFVAPPDHWADDDKSRVNAHFREYDLKKKFSVEAAAELPETIQTRRTTMSANTPQDFSGYLAEKGNMRGLPINNWRRVMFTALAADNWFCNQAFADMLL